MTAKHEFPHDRRILYVTKLPSTGFVHPVHNIIYKFLFFKEYMTFFSQPFPDFLSFPSSRNVYF